MHTKGKSGFYYGYVIVAAAFILMFMLMGSYFSFGVFMKPLIAQYGWTRAVTASPYSFSWVMGGLAGLVLGMLNDRFGPRIVFSVSAVLAGAGYLLMPLTTTIFHFYLFYGVLIGFGCNIFVPTMSVMARIFNRRRTLMSGIASVGSGLGGMVMPPLLTRMIEAWGLNTSFLVVGIATIVVSLPVAQLMRQDMVEENKEPQPAEGGRKRRYLQQDMRSLTTAQALKTAQFWLFEVMVFCMGFCIFVAQVHIVPYVTDTGFSAETGALVLAAIGGISIFGRIVLGNSGDRVGNKPLMAFGFALMLASVLLLLPLQTLWVFFLFAVIFGIAYGDCAAQESPIIAWIFGLKSHGMIFGLIGCGFTLGAAVGPVVAGSIFDLTGSYHIAFIVTAASAAIGLLATVLIRPVGENKENL